MTLREWLLQTSQIDILIALNNQIMKNPFGARCLGAVLSDYKKQRTDCDRGCLNCLCNLLDKEMEL